MIANRFETVLADTQTAKDIHYQVRYQVFCEETGFEDRERFPDERERDQFDEHATHFIIWDRLEREWVAAMRLVPAAHQALPCETICADDLAGLSERRQRSVECSRLCILTRHRQTAFGNHFGRALPDGERAGVGDPVFFHQEDHELFLRMVRVSIDWARRTDVEYCYFIITRALSRMLKRFGVPLEVVGEAVEHRGQRIPHAYQVHAADAGIRATLDSYGRMSRNSLPFVAFSDFTHRPVATSKIAAFPSQIAVAAHLAARGSPALRSLRQRAAA